MIDKKRILLIDDEKDFCFFVKNNLKASEGFAVNCANDPDKGIRLARRQHPDLILLDIKMPKKDGFEVLSILKNDTKTLSIPVIMLTAIDDESARIKAARLYDEDYIAKPVDHALLKRAIKKVLTRYKNFKA
ncbi:MAG: response regulator [Omnitrophica bacterium]|nr:response regulator [Candidatus Omnitrophota bacterium]